MRIRHVLFILAVAGCKKDAPPPIAPHVLTITARNYAYAAPDTVPAGLTRIVLIGAGPELHHVQLLKLDSGKTLDSLRAAMRQPGPFPAWAHEVGGPNTGAPVDTTEIVQTLEPGYHVLICFIPDTTGTPHFVRGMLRPMMVVADAGPSAPEPTADLEITLSDFAFTESVPLTAGSHTIRVTNDGPQPHEMVLVRLDSGATSQQLVAWIEHGMKGRPMVTPVGGFAALASGQHAFVTVSLTPGKYGLICLVPDVTDGRPHTAHGMLKDITVN